MLANAISKAMTFKRDEQGTIAILFGLTGIAMCLFLGSAIDMGRTISTRSKIAAAADSAALAAAKALRLEGLNATQAIALANRVFAENIKATGGNWTQINSINVTIDSATGAAQVDVDAFVKSAFLGLAGVPALTVKKTAVAVFDSRDVEVGVQLDLTGSMCSPCSKLSDLKQATKDLIDILIPDSSIGQKVRVGLAPFSAGVNVGPFLRDVNGNRSSTNNCVYERMTATNETTDVEPSGSDAFKIRPDFSGSIQNCPGSELITLTSDKTLLKDTVNHFSTASSTAGQLGAAWAWYLVSPRWANIWPIASRPAAYGDSKTDKVVILMTDGVYNTIGGVNFGDTSSQAVTASNLSVDVCTNMKAAGVKVYTVGFDLDRISQPSAKQRAIDTLNACASSPSSFYKADDGEQLRTAFRDIANSILTLRLAK